MPAPDPRANVLRVLSLELGCLDPQLLAAEVVDRMTLADDLEMTVLDAVGLHKSLEHEFGVEITDDEFEASSTVGQLVALITRKVGQDGSTLPCPHRAAAG